jgi:hypothetical protein
MNFSSLQSAKRVISAVRGIRAQPHGMPRRLSAHPARRPNSTKAVRSIRASHVLTSGIVALAVGVAITLGGVHARLASVVLAGTVVAGFGFGATFTGTMRSLLPLAEAGKRAGLLSAFYVIGYLAFALPAMLAGYLAAMIGLVEVAESYGTVVIVLALASMVATLLSQAKRQRV